MRNPFNSRRRIAVVAAGAAILLGGVTALAYWTTTGSGTGTASTTTGVDSTLTFATSSINAMYPGNSSQFVTVTVTNPSTTQKVTVAGVKAYITTSNAGCTGGDFLLNGSTAPSTALTAVPLDWTATELLASPAAGAHAATSGLDTIQFNDKLPVTVPANNQDACKNATVTLNYVAS